MQQKTKSMKTAKITLEYQVTGQATEDQIADAIIELMSQAQFDGVSGDGFAIQIGEITVDAHE